MLAEGATLREHLLDQLQSRASTIPVKSIIGAHIIDLLDDAGYLKEDLASIAEMLGADVADIEEVLHVLQRFDPAGVCARSLSECLALQLKDRDRLDPAMQSLLDNLNLLGDGEVGELHKRCGVDKDDLRQMVVKSAS